jgi:hypothetical protein
MEEMAGTLMSFSALILDGLDQLGVELTESEKDAYMHCWNIVGHFIGITPELYPKNYKEGWDLGIAIIKRNQSESPDSQHLTSSLLEFSSQFFNAPAFRKMPIYLMHYFVKNVSDKIGVDILKTLGVNEYIPFHVKVFGWIFLRLMKIGHALQKHSRFIKRLTHRYLLKYMQALVHNYLKNYNVEFFIPETLNSNWNIKK